MRVLICAVGRLRPGPERTLVDDYAARFGRTGRGLGMTGLDVVEVEARRGGGAEAEAALLARACPDGAWRVALDERGQTAASPDVADLLQARRDAGARDLTFLIGGADGLDADLRDGCDRVISLGAMVWPHALCRVMLAEQLYRAATILAGTPYHRA